MFLNLLSNVPCVTLFTNKWLDLFEAVCICKKVFNLIYIIVLRIQIYSLLRD